tara:strand:+ start:40492 stop:41979 length:1488 start_codon:yes stop_codon:yes gene_type:complete
MINYANTKPTIYLVGFFTFLSLILATMYLQSIADKQSGDWLIHSENEIKRSELLQEIVTNIGFGGFIHNYKNSILRKDISALEQSSAQIARARELIHNYREIYPVGDELLLDVDAVLAEYYGNVTLIKSLINQGLSAELIDEQVRVNDFSALQSISALISSNRSVYKKIAKSSAETVDTFKQSILGIFFFIILLVIASIFYIVFILNKNIFQFKRIGILFDLAPLSIIAVNEDGYISSANKIALETFGLDKNTFTDINIDQLTPDAISKHHKKYREEFQSSERTVPMHQRGGQFNAQRLNGEVFPANISIATYSQGGVKEAIVVVKDISDEVKQIHDANFDPLTQLPNRRSIDGFLNEAILRSKRQDTDLYMAIIDIDYFKKINDKFGHSFGDSVLIDSAKYLQENIRETDFIGRWGGEEFLLILEDTCAEGALNVCEKIRMYIAEQSKLKGCQYTVSIGCAKYSKDSDTEILFDHADVALYLSKNDGRNKTTMM